MVVLSNVHGLQAEIAQHGAALAAMRVPDRGGSVADVVLGHLDATARRESRSFLGSSVGRVAGRISGACFDLDGQQHTLASVDGCTCLHGGPAGFDTRPWQWLDVQNDRARLQLISPDDDQGFPGELRITVEYTLDDTDALHVEYTATCDRATAVSLTHHPFWNLAGEGAGTVDAHRLTLPASSFLELRPDLTPTGRRLDVTGSAFDFRDERALGDGLSDRDDAQLQRAAGFDHYWILDTQVPGALRLAARLHEPSSGRVLHVWIDQPGLQVYTGNFLDGSLQGRSGRSYRARGAICLEPQGFPDAMNHPEFPSIVLRPGEVYRNRIVYRFSKDTQ